MARVQLNAITKSYGEFRAVDGVSLDIAEGEFVVLLGPSGCGKTTTLRIIAGFIEPTSGSIRLGGPTSPNCRRGSAMPGWCSRATRCFRI